MLTPIALKETGRKTRKLITQILNSDKYWVSHLHNLPRAHGKKISASHSTRKLTKASLKNSRGSETPLIRN